MSLKKEIFKKQLNENVLQVQASYSISWDMMNELSKEKIDDIIKHELSQGIVNEIKDELAIERFAEPIPFDMTGKTTSEVHSTRVFFMSEDTYLWLLSEIRILFDEKERKKL